MAVIDSIGFNDQTWLQGTGAFHSEDLHLTERYTRVSKDRIDYEVKMEDPKVFTKPWVIHSSIMLREERAFRKTSARKTIPNLLSLKSSRETEFRSSDSSYVTTRTVVN